MKLAFNKILNSPGSIMLSSKRVVNSCVVIKNRIFSHAKMLKLSKCSRVGQNDKRDKDGFFPCPAIL